MATTYFGTKISENVGETPDGFRVFLKNYLGRTGWQRYTVADLIKNFTPERLAELQVDTSNPYASIDLYRPAEEVFAEQTITSAESKPVTDGHPPEFVDPDNFREYARGHITNVRKGAKALESGDWPIEADIIINDADLIRKIDAGQKQLSLGYSYDLARDSDKLLQINFVINHCASVREARAGSEARIYDSAPAAETTDEMKLVEAAAWKPTDSAPERKPVPITTVKEKAAVKKNSMFHRLLKALALDTEATPEDVVEGSKLLHKAMDEESEEEMKKRESEDAKRKHHGRGGWNHDDEEEEKKKADDARRMKDEAEEKEKKEKKESEDKRAKDEAEAATKKREAEEKDAKGKDGECKPGEEGHMKCTADKCMAKDSRAHDRGAKDADGGDHRSRMHSALDNMLDKHEEMHGPLEGEDADMEELKDLMGKFLSEEGQEPEHSEDEVQGSEMLEPVGDPEEEGMMANDAAAAVLEAIEKSTERKTLQRAFDAAPIDNGEFEFLKAIKPAIAKSKDKRVRSAFDAQVRKHTRTSRTGTGSYEAFGAAARANDAARITAGIREAGANGRMPQDNTKIAEIYKAARDGKPLVNKG